MKTLFKASKKISLKHDKNEQDEFKKERDAAHSARNVDQAEYDKQLLTLSAGFLAISLAFIKDVVPINAAIHLNFLYASFIFVALSMIIVLYSFQYSSYVNLKLHEYWDAKINGDEEAAKELLKKIDTGSDCVGYINYASGIAFAVGVVLILTFVIMNISNEAQMKNKPQGVKDGQTIKVPSNPSNEERGQTIKVPAPPSKETPANTNKK